MPIKNLAPHDTLDVTDLDHVTGALRIDDLPPSSNIEDRRDGYPLTNRIKDYLSSWLPHPAIPVGPRTPNDLPHQLGYDDIPSSPGRDAWFATSTQQGEEKGVDESTTQDTDAG